MKITPIWVDVAPYLAARVQPTYLHERELPYGDNPRGDVFAVAELARIGQYYTLISSVLEENPVWSDTHYGRYVRIPVTAFRTTSCALSAIFATGLEIGVKAVESFRLLDQVKPIEELILVLGTECTQLSDAFRCYVGISFKTGE